ncbi:histidine phosphatase family protein [Rhodopseudomonas palustris]|uniref:histidine phosphatase family protein n=1 Tax=Rhodopseudomonas palustris TaxID=1076 RepID=UPI0020CC2F00|nr:histidine phosphatase family protein [Rhodopseudomonas palustris]MCP9626363.1 histidine phosphatase family protein [Rhodopseudomonas palustris]
MVKAIHLVRHGHHALLGKKLCGRMPGVDLDDCGREQMWRCAELMTPPPDAIQSSPQPRTRQSASLLAAQFDLPIEIVGAADEIDVGSWTGVGFADLARDPRWRTWNEQRGTARPPGGESMGELQRRIVRHIEALRDDPSDTIAIVSHAEPIRAALLYYLNRSLDDFLSVEVEPASISTLLVWPDRISIRDINRQVPA